MQKQAMPQPAPHGSPAPKRYVRLFLFSLIFLSASTAFTPKAFAETSFIPGNPTEKTSTLSSIQQSACSMESLFREARQYFGIRYRWGGQTPAGFDCSGFVRYMFGKVFQLHLPRSSREMAAIGSKVNRSELQPGDLVFFGTKGGRINHVGIFIGNDTFMHSSLSKGITEDKLQQNYYDKRFVGGVRLPELPRTMDNSFMLSQPEQGS
ncbi:MAG: C40 family peptidase [Chlorobiaceae bacterium]|jgi:cell wall-associated NlpC family hydrolase|nr:C40 family peptidase [Chlorobiaceae bacterium]NTW63987.1 C40 family peptidase [Chlorobiaceae bacterium]